MGGKIHDLSKIAIYGWREGNQAVSVQPEESAIRGECAGLYEKLTQLTFSRGDATMYVDLMLICRHLERIVRHAVCVADEATSGRPGGPCAARICTGAVRLRDHDLTRELRIIFQKRLLPL